MNITLLRRPAVEAKIGRPRSSLYAMVKNRTFIKPVSIGARSVAWPAHEVDALIQAQIAGKSDEEIKALVAELEAARKSKA